MYALQCPKCGVSTHISLTESSYEGPFRCWKCKASLLVKIQGEELKSYKIISEKELHRYIE